MLLQLIYELLGCLKIRLLFFPPPFASPIALHKIGHCQCNLLIFQETCSPSSKCAGKGKQKQLAEDWQNLYKLKHFAPSTLIILPPHFLSFFCFSLPMRILPVPIQRVLSRPSMASPAYFVFVAYYAFKLYDTANVSQIALTLHWNPVLLLRFHIN